jgi:hypothetical protein
MWASIVLALAWPPGHPARGHRPVFGGSCRRSANIFGTNAGDPPFAGCTPFSVDLSLLFGQNRGETLRLRFAEADHLAQLQPGVDSVEIDVLAAPEPTPLILLGTGLAGVLVRGRQQRPPPPGRASLASMSVRPAGPSGVPHPISGSGGRR